MFKNPRRGRQATNFKTNVAKILDLKLSTEQIFSENCLWVPLPSAESDLIIELVVEIKRNMFLDNSIAKFNESFY